MAGGGFQPPREITSRAGLIHASRPTRTPATSYAVTPWPVRAWRSAWDGDALSGVVQGRLEIPTNP
jgi:hypothetical protein